MSPVATPMAQQQIGLRCFLLLLPVLLLAGSVVLLVASPSAWGAGDVIGLPSWMPPAFGLGMALGGTAISVFAIRVVLERTRGEYEVFPLQLVFGSLMFVAGGAMQVGIASQIGQPAAYDSRFGGTMPLDVFAFITMVTPGLVLAMVWAAAYTYVHALTDHGPSKNGMLRLDEPDAIGLLLVERRR